MVKTYKIIVGGKRGTGKTSILEQLIYNNLPVSKNTFSNDNESLLLTSSSNSASTTPASMSPARNVDTVTSTHSGSSNYFSTIEDIYVASWERDRGITEKLRFYDTKGMESSKDIDTINVIT
jgi:GTPase SAR1 family protein